MFLSIRRRVWPRFTPRIVFGGLWAPVGWAFIGWIFVGSSACGVGMAGSSGDVVCVAASVRDAVADVFAKNFREVVLATGSSGSLSAAIENGAPCEVFVSASVLEVDLLRARGLVVASSGLVGNRLVVAESLARAEHRSKGGSRAGSVGGRGMDAALDVLSSGGLVAIGNPSVVPAGRYAEAWLESVGLLASLQPRLVFTANARATLAAVESGSVRVGIVYATDAALSSDVSVVGVIEEPLEGFGEVGPIHYVAALLGDAEHPPSLRARELYSELRSPFAVTVYEAAGFRVLSEEAVLNPAADGHS